MIKFNLIMVFALLSLQIPVSAQDTNTILYIEQAVRLAQENDPWIEGSKHMQDATSSMSVAAGSLPDPQVSLGLANLPTDSFSFNQDGMTQIKLGVSQMFPQGDSLNIKRRQLEIKAGAFPYLREDRYAKVSVIVGHLWLDAYKAKKTIALIEQNRSLFEQLSEIALSSYSSALGRTRQQDIIRAQLELTRLNDRVTMLNQSQDAAMKTLSEWLNIEGNLSADYLNFTIAEQMPDTQISRPEYIDQILSDEAIYDQLSNHPMLSALEQKIKASGAGVDLARQKYKPAWGVNASYGRRNNDPFGGSRSDNLSVGVSLSVPLFTANRQDKEYQSAVSSREAVRTEKWQTLRKLKAGLDNASAQLIRLNERKELFRSALLPQMNEQAEASLTAYTNDDGDFAEVVRARIAELNAQIDALNIDVARQKTIIQLNYFFTTSTEQVAFSGETK